MSTDRIKYKEEARIFCTQRMRQVEQFLIMQLQNCLRFKFKHRCFVFSAVAAFPNSESKVLLVKCSS